MSCVTVDAGQEDPRSAGQSYWFEEVSEAFGVGFDHVRAISTEYWFPEIMSGGAAWCDFNADGFLDLYLVQGGELDASRENPTTNRLFRNLGNGSFVDVTEKAGVGDSGYGMGATCGDYDGDGDVDLYVTNVGSNKLFRNRGDATFADVTQSAGVGDAGWGSSSAFVDLDGDRDLDLFVVNYVNWSPSREIECSSGARRRDYCQPENYRAPAPDTLYRNQGDGSFVDVSSDSGIRKAFGNGLGVVAGDFDSDGRMDLYVTNDSNPNQLWINAGNGRFEDQGLISGSAVNMAGATEAGMGVASTDLENDGDLDLFMTHLRGETNTFYRNLGGGFFEDITAITGLALPSMSLTGFGAGFADFDHDGREDLFIANGRVGQGLAPLVDSDPFAEPNLLFWQTGDHRFEEVMPRGGTAKLMIDNSRAAAFGDYDNDGDIDIAIVNNGGRAKILRNIATKRGNWISFRVVDRNDSDAIGARLRITTGAAANKTQWRLVQTAYSYCASNDPRVHFGVGRTQRIEDVLVIWPGGERERFGPFSAGKIYVLQEGSGRQLAAPR